MTSYSAVESEDINDTDAVDVCDRSVLCDSPDRDRSCRSSIITRIAQVRACVVEKTHKCFLFGPILLIIGATFYLNSKATNDENIFYLSLLFIFVGGIFVWIPMYCWMNEPIDHSDPSASHQVREPSTPHVRDKPPDYESLTPLPQDLVAPPAYEDVFRFCEQPQGSRDSEAVCIDIPVCSVHQPSVVDMREQGTILNIRTLTRSKSTNDLCRAERELDQV